MRSVLTIVCVAGLAWGLPGRAQDAPPSRKPDVEWEPILRIPGWQGRAGQSKASGCLRAHEPSLDDLASSLDDLAGEVARARRCQGAATPVAGVPAATEGAGATSAPLLDRRACEALVITQRVRLARVKKWLREYWRRSAAGGECSAQRGAVSSLRARLTSDVQDPLYQLMDDMGLREPITAEIVSGLLHGRSTNEPGDEGEQQQATYLRWSTRRFFWNGDDQDRKVELQAWGRFGRLPALSLVAPEASAGDGATATNAGTTDRAPATTDLPATVFDVHLDAVLTSGESLELVAQAGVGQIWLGSETSLKKLDGRDVLLELLPLGGKASAGTFREVGVRLRWFSARRVVRAEQPSIKPVIEVGFDWRRDQRLKRLERAGFDFASPGERFTARLNLVGIPLTNKEDARGKPLRINLGAEHEFGRSGGVPATTRVFLSGELSILKALMGQQ